MDDQIQLREKENWKPAHFLHLIILLFLNLNPVYCKKWDGVIVTKSDYQALRAIKHELLDFRGVLNSWNETGPGPCSGWAGIKCAKGQVIAIELPWKVLGGRISDKIGKLKALRRLSLHDNVLVGPVPMSIRLLSNLRGVYLFNNRLSGSIPPPIGNCLNLHTLDLSNNQLFGTIPSSLAKLNKMYRLNLSYNGISGLLRLSLARIPSLTFLDLQHNNISGFVPGTWGSEISVNYSYKLEGLNLSHNLIVGNIPDELGNLSRLNFLDLSDNAISGNIPESFSKLSSLVTLNLKNNNLDSQIPGFIEKMSNLAVINLSNNKFVGKIPETIGNITSLTSLDLSDNNLTGEIPISIVNLPNLSFFDVSHNNLSGSVPSVLAKKFNSSSFLGNIQLCGYSRSTPCPSQNPPSHNQGVLEVKNHHHKKLSTKDITVIASGALLFALVILCCAPLCCLLRKKSVSKAKKGKSGDTKPVLAVGQEVGPGGEMGGKLVHFDGPFEFTADDLLCATAEIMGKSTYGTAYKATLEDGNQVGVKRLREKITKERKEFEVEIDHLGKIRHPNILALRAYYLGPKGEKLLVYDYMPNGSLASFLHARGPETIIPWPTRMAVVMGTTRGLCHLHDDQNTVHGNLTSSNILLDEQTNPKIADVGLSRLMMKSTANSDAVPTAGTMGYRAPELSKPRNATAKSDVFSLGVIILELLTGKSPSEANDGLDLPEWVASIVKEEWTNEVFDVELMRDSSDIGDELLNALKLGLHCVDPSPEDRPEAKQVLEKLEEIRPGPTGVGEVARVAERSE